MYGGQFDDTSSHLVRQIKVVEVDVKTLGPSKPATDGTTGDPGPISWSEERTTGREGEVCEEHERQKLD